MRQPTITLTIKPSSNSLSCGHDSFFKFDFEEEISFRFEFPAQFDLDLAQRKIPQNRQLSLSAADLIRRHVLCNCKSGPMALKLEEQQFLGEASCTLSEIATKVDGTSTLNLALEEVPSPAHTHHSGQLTIYAEESVALDTTAAETGEKLSILMSAGQNHQDKIQLLVDKYSENNQHTCLDLNPTVAIDITGDRNCSVACLVEKVTSILRVSRPPLLPLSNTDCAKPAEARTGKALGFMVFCAVIWNGISFGEIYPCLGNILQLLGITLVLCLLCLLVGTFLPAGFSLACWLSAVLYLLPFLYLIIKPHPQPYLRRFSRRKVGKDGAPTNIDSEKADGEAREGEREENKKRSVDGGKQGTTPKKLKKDNVVGATTKAHRPDNAAASGAPHVKPELALPVIPVEVEQSILEDLRNLVQLSSMALPSISFYTFINTHDSLNCASISQDGSMVAGGFSDSSLKVDYFSMHSIITNHLFALIKQWHLIAVRLWSTKLNANLVCYKGHNYPVWDVQSNGPLSDVDCVQWHANCNYIATGSSDKTVRLWDVQSGECVRIFIGHRSMILSLAMSPDGRYMASGDEDGTIMMWDLASGRCVSPLVGHGSCIWSLAFSCEGSLLASGSADCTVKIWDVATSSKVPKADENPVYALQFSRRNLLFAAGALSKQS
ncbi:TBP-associated factor 5 [Perilla frutescens var. frutescens]|nr:TBP-associated factor 5 [Perilla frutescens var. frutescens]